MLENTSNDWRRSRQSDLWVRRHLGTPSWDTVLELRGIPHPVSSRTAPTDGISLYPSSIICSGGTVTIQGCDISESYTGVAPPSKHPLTST